MMRLTEASAAMAGEFHGADASMTGVTTDSRQLAPGDLFFALKGERFDAAQFVDQALAAGAAGAVVERDSFRAVTAGGALILVDDSRAALGRLAASWRQRFHLPLVGLTGSNGKTTVKDMIATVLRVHCADPAQVLATEGNLNNDIGLPLTLLRLRATHRYAVIEMGMNHPGEIRYLTGLTRPDIALINNAGTAHIGLLGSREAIARAKGEIFEGLSASGTAVLNADDTYAQLWRDMNAGRRIVDFGLEQPAEVRGRYSGHALSSDIVLTTPGGEARFNLPLPGEHNVRNALAAAAAAHALDIPAALTARALASFRGPKGRMQRYTGIQGSVVIDDSYNANPDSTLAAISVLAHTPGKRVLVLGDMGELGEEGAALHARVGEAARTAGIERLLTLGELSEHASRAFGPRARHFCGIEDLLAAVRAELGPDTTLLVKGSRFMQMERVVQSFKVDPA